MRRSFRKHAKEVGYLFLTFARIFHPSTMSSRPKVIAKIQADLGGRFRVVDNTGEDKKVIGGQFPDILVYGKDPPINETLLFVMKVENGSPLLDSVGAWKELGSSPVGFYVVVPKDKLDDAKRLVGATGAKARFAWYEVQGDVVTQVQYE